MEVMCTCVIRLLYSYISFNILKSNNYWMLILRPGDHQFVFHHIKSDSDKANIEPTNDLMSLFIFWPAKDENHIDKICNG